METTTAKPVLHDSLAIYRDARDFGSLAAIYNAAGRRDRRALAILAGMQSDANGESNGFGIRACVLAAIKGQPYATLRIDAVTTADIV
jgi:hypothetical protein